MNTITKNSTDRFQRAARVRSDDTAVTASIAGGKLLLSFSKPVVVRGLPAGVTVNGAAPTAMQRTSPTALLLTYTTPVASGQTWAIANKEPHLRTPRGGYVAAVGGTFSA